MADRRDAFQFRESGPSSVVAGQVVRKAMTRVIEDAARVFQEQGDTEYNMSSFDSLASPSA
jgi:hypothetical protein